MHEDVNAQSGLVHGFVLDGQGGARRLAREALDSLSLQPEESLWLHWDRSHPMAQEWLRQRSGLSEFSCDLLLEENTRPRLLALPGDELLLFLRGVNLNPGAEPEDMVSIRIFANAQQLISMRLRPMRAVNDLALQFAQGQGPKTISELMLGLASQLTSKPSQITEAMPKVHEKTRASRGDSWPVTRGRFLVRPMILSISVSMKQLNALADPALWPLHGSLSKV